MPVLQKYTQVSLVINLSTKWNKYASTGVYHATCSSEKQPERPFVLRYPGSRLGSAHDSGPSLPPRLVFDRCCASVERFLLQQAGIACFAVEALNERFKPVISVALSVGASRR